MKICYFIICLVFASHTQSQVQHDSTIREHAHHILLGIGSQRNSFFTGPSLMMGYQYHTRQSFISLHYQYSEELLIFGGRPQTANEISALYNLRVGQNRILSVGAGLAYTTILADSYNILGPPSQGTTNRPSQLKKTTIGFPLNMNVMIPSKRIFTGGVNLHANFNKYTTLFNIGFIMSFKVS